MPRPCTPPVQPPPRPPRSAAGASPPPVSPGLMGLAAMGVDGAAILIALGLALALDPGIARPSLLYGAAVFALGTLGAGLLRQDYDVTVLLAGWRPARRLALRWMLAAGVLLAAEILTGLAMHPTRAAGFAAVAAGLTIALGGRLALAALGRRWAVAGRLTVERLMLLGPDAAVAAFLSRNEPTRHGLRLVAAAVLRHEPLVLGEDLTLAIATARMRKPDRIVLLLPWTDEALIVGCVEALRCLPAAIHLGPTALVERLATPMLDPLAPLVGLPLVRPPLSRLDRRLKRAFDIVAASLALVALAPVLVTIAAAVKLDSPGPVFFRQRRTGFNQQPFRIIKFRSMTTLEDSATLRQVTDGDPRVTRVGRILRATSLDELPQLMNVLTGDMSLIGPRPHALAHDQAFGRSHALYGRRHTIRPGITGWAQVRGFRGETDTPDKIEGRVRHDLDYIENWSLRLDLVIMLRTVFSRQTFRNAK